MKRFIDIIGSTLGLIIFSPLLVIAIFFIWLEDKKSPFYIAKRVGKKGRLFNMVKLRSMVVNAHKTGVASTSENDIRITSIGKIIRKYKLDELSQLWNVLLGDMSLVGPRPNVQSETNLYTDVEQNILLIKPGITDFSSIIFSDESKILKDFINPDLAYNQLIRPYKSRFCLFYIDNRNILIDFILILITIVGIKSRVKSLKLISFLLKKINAPDNLVKVALRKEKLMPIPPPGSNEIVMER